MSYIDHLSSRHDYAFTVEELRALWGCVRLHFLPRSELATLAETLPAGLPQDMLDRALSVRLRLDDDPSLLGVAPLFLRRAYRRCPITGGPVTDASPTGPYHADDLDAQALRMGWWHPRHRSVREKTFRECGQNRCPCCDPWERSKYPAGATEMDAEVGGKVAGGRGGGGGNNNNNNNNTEETPLPSPFRGGNGRPGWPGRRICWGWGTGHPRPAPAGPPSPWGPT